MKVDFNEGQLYVNKTGKKLALTFDDGPAMETAAVLDILKREKVVATFFVIGKNIAGNEELLQRMKAEGHSIGNHSFNHGFNFDWQSATNMQRELEATNAAIEQATGAQVTLFRPPYGVTNPNLGKAIKNTGMKSIGWNLRSMDTVAKDPQKLQRKILSALKPACIILLHDRCPITVNILPTLIQEIKKRGYEFATL